MRVTLVRALGRKKPGETISVTAMEARALNALGYLRRDMQAEVSTTPSPKKRTYKRRDMRAVD